MTAFRSRLDRLEQVNGPKVWGRFITVRAGKCTDVQARSFLRQQGVIIGARDLVLLDTHADPGTSGYIAPSDPISHQILECTKRFEDMLSRLD